MCINLPTLGIVSTALGALVLLLNNIFTGWYDKDYNKPWYKRYYWSGWRPIFKIHPPSEKPRWMVKWDSKVVRYGVIPPKYALEIIGFLFILIGTILQIISL